MCQAVRDGGRRCPVHQHQNIAFIKAAASLHNLNRYQSERLFAELRREGRGHTVTDTTDTHAALRTAVENDSTLTDSVTEELNKAHLDQEVDGATVYAQSVLLARAEARAQKMTERFTEVANRTGLTVDEVRTKYTDFWNSVDTSRGVDAPEEYTQNTRRAAVVAGLPYDQASVVAWEKLNKLEVVGNQRRVQLMNAPVESHIQAFGYDEGRLEVVFSSNPDRTYAYQNVPEEVWDRFSTSESPGRIFAAEIRGNVFYQYDNEEAAEADAVRIRCEACGQFAASTPSCPQREANQEGNNLPVTVQEMDSAELPVPQESEPVVEVPEERPTAEIPDPTPVPVTGNVALPDIPAYNPEPINFTEENLNGTANLNTVQINADSRPEVWDRAVTPTSQFLPEAVSPESMVIETVEVDSYYPSTLVIKPGLDLENTLSYHRFSAEEMESLKRKQATLSEHDRFVLVYDYRQMLHEGSVYDNRVISVASRKERTTTQLNYFPTRKDTLTTGQTREEYDAASSEQFAKWDAHIASGDAVQIPSNSTSTRRYVYDANLKNQPSIRTGSVNKLKAAFRDNKVAVMQIAIDNDSTFPQGFDDQGYAASLSAGSFISGTVALRRNSEGVAEVISGHQTLRCNCRVYRNNYDCTHIRHALRHIGNVAQQMAPSPELVSQSSSSRSERPAGLSRLMTAPLRRRTDVSVETDPEGNEYLSFGETVPAENFQRSRSRTSASANRMAHLYHPVADESGFVDPQNPTREELLENLTAEYLTSHSATWSTVPRLAQVRAALKRSDVKIPISLYGNGYSYQIGSVSFEVTGTVTYNKTADPEDTSTISVKETNLKCNCEVYQRNYTCTHTRFAATQSHLLIHASNPEYAAPVPAENYHSALRNHIDPEIRGRMLADPQLTFAAAEEEIRQEREAQERRQREYAERIARERAERQERIDRQRRERLAALTEANASSVEASVNYRAKMVEKWATVEDTYEENPENFFTDYKDALRRKRNGEEAIPFRTENVTDGICDPNVEGSRRFGVELEFVMPSAGKAEALRTIARELHAAGLTESPHQGRYHSARSSGWGSWSFEQDSTVDGELVSPILSDTPEHWEQLRKACEIITRNGGKVNSSVGSHVHISTASYESSTAKHAELLRVVGQNEDLMYRMAANPATGRHRGTRWCAPNTIDHTAGDFSAEDVSHHNVLGYHSSHNYGMNFEGTGLEEFKKSQVEFRMWDGTLDPAVIQQQVMMSAAITDLAERNVIKNNGSKKPTEPAEKIGHNKTKETQALTASNQTETHSVDSFKASHESVGKFFDSLFRRKEDRAAATALLAVTKWQQ